ncbi:MAG: HAMP domain-containing histidine kinase [Bacteroidales bacterium]|nr:HAMP domain-containing histidine kinase [Bacteroidales bacterium]
MLNNKLSADLYAKKKRWKVALSIIAVVIVTLSMYYTNNLVKRFALQEQRQMTMWAEAVQTHAELMNYTEVFFNEVSIQESKRVELLAMAYRRFLAASSDENISVYLDIIQSNISIPVVITDSDNNITLSINLPKKHQDKEIFDAEMRNDFSIYPPIKIDIYGKESSLYYNESLIYTELRNVLDDMFTFFINDVADNAAGVPVIILNQDRSHILSFGNLDESNMNNSDYVQKQIDIMSSENMPIEVNYLDGEKAYIYYRSSDLLRIVRYFPIIQILVFIFFIIVAYLLFSYARRSEQNQVWAGMAKETAHQIGTPLTSLMGWIELLKMQDTPFIGTTEMEKDIDRMKTITERFSKIGSIPTLEAHDVTAAVNDTMNYLKRRFSNNKFEFDIKIPNREIVVPLDAALFSWVLENLTKNALDAMEDHGKLTVEMTEDAENIYIDVTDTGKGMQRSTYKQVFQPGYTSKKRGWGLGLSLARRIIEDYHKGKIFVKNSVVGQGTTFRIALKKKTIEN